MYVVATAGWWEGGGAVESQPIKQTAAWFEGEIGALTRPIQSCIYLFFKRQRVPFKRRQRERGGNNILTILKLK